MTTWRDLEDELDRWGETDRVATLWWRDDDAVTATPALETLLSIRRQGDTPMALAVVPADADDALVAALPGSGVVVLQHGYAHANHEGAGRAKSELGCARPADIVAAELARGHDRLSALFGVAALPVLVPPWNRMASRLLGVLTDLRYRGVSMYKPRRCAEPASGVRCVNTHVDIVDWRGMRGFGGEDAALGALAGHLSARRTGAADVEEATGILTHHLVHDAACTDFLTRLTAVVQDHRAARWVSAVDLFGAG